MALLASSEPTGLGALLVLAVLALGAARIGRTISGSGAIKGAVKDGMLGLLGKLFRR